jgi:hypothetical protein
MPILPTANLKNSTHVNLVLRAAAWDRKLAADFVDWLAIRSTAPLTDEAKQAHLDELERRLAGKSFVSLSGDSAVSLRDLGAMPIVLRHFSYARIKRPGLDLSFDVFNAGNELALGDEPAGLVLEIFAVDGRTITPLVELAIEAVRDWPVEYAFGGTNAFTAIYTLAHRRAKEEGRTLHVRDFLWPFTFSKDLAGVTDETLKQLPVFRSGREAGGVWIWLFEDLSMGHNDHYAAAAKALGLRSLWEQEILYGPGSR